IFVFCSGVRLRLASETEHAGFASFPTFLVHSPCSPANTVPAANIPATTSAMNLVIVQHKTLAYAVSFKDLRRVATRLWPVKTARRAVATLIKLRFSSPIYCTRLLTWRTDLSKECLQLS